MADIVERLRAPIPRDVDCIPEAQDRMAEAAAEIERLRAVQAWRPIGTAPKDGTRVLLWPVWSDGLPDAGWWEVRPRSSGWVHVYGRVLEKPTHWQPLPEPPAQGTPDA